MTFELHDTHQDHTDYSGGAAGSGEAEQESGLRLELMINEADIVAALVAYPEGRDRNRFVRTALRIGILALNQAQGRIDSESVRNEGDRLVREIESRLADYRRQTEGQLAATLKEYFDPQNGRFNERVERLVRQDGELEKLMRTRMEEAERTLADTLTRHVGADSVLMQHLEPGESNRFLNALRGHVEETLATQANAILREFSLDNSEGALARWAERQVVVRARIGCSSCALRALTRPAFRGQAASVAKGGGMVAPRLLPLNRVQQQ